MRVAVIGAGIAGLVSACKLLKKNFLVDIYDLSEFPGGKMYHYTNSKGVRFDTGPTLISLPSIIKNTFESIEHPCPELLPLKEGCQFYFHDGNRWDFPENKQKIFEYLNQKDSKLALQFENAMEISKSIYDFADKNLFHDDPPSILGIGLKSVASGILFSHPKYMVSNYFDVVNNLFENKNMREIFYHFASYIGVQPKIAAGAILSIAQVEMGSPIVFPKGGVYSIVQALYEAAIKNSAKFFFQSKVISARPIGSDINNRGWQIQFVKNNKIQQNSYDLVICNGDPYTASQAWIESAEIKNYFSSRITKYNLVPSESQFVILFEWENFTSIPHHVKLFPKSFIESYEEVSVKLKIPEDPCVYLVWPHATDKSVSPNALFISAMAPNLKSGHEWDENFCQNYIGKIMKICCKRMNISFQGNVFKIITPKELNQRTQSFQGGMYSANVNTFQPTYFQFSGKTKTDNFYFVGAGVHPGAGVPMVMNSASRIVSSVLSKYQ